MTDSIHYPCAKQIIIATITAVDGRTFVGSNWCRNDIRDCPRAGMLSGEGYELCRDICGQENHAEVDACIRAGEAARGATLTLTGHTYICDNCLRVMNEYGIADYFMM